MDISDTQLLRELRRALDAVAGEGADAQARALEETMQRLDATMPDVVRALNSVRERRRTEIARLAGRIDALASGFEEAEETAEAVDQFLRGMTGDRPA
jgi:hypothetical protein